MLPIVLIVVAVGLALAVVKPWGTADPAGRRSETETGVPVPTAAATPRGLPTLRTENVAVDPAAIPCVNAGWRIVTLEHTYGRETRTWIAVEPVPATHATDPSIPVIRVVADRVLALGYCPEGDGYGDARLSRIRPGRGGASVPTRLDPDLAAAPGPALSHLYAPPGRAQAWPPGRYVVEVPPLRGRRPASMWFTVEVVAAPPLPSP